MSEMGELGVLLSSQVFPYYVYVNKIYVNKVTFGNYLRIGADCPGANP